MSSFGVANRRDILTKKALKELVRADGADHVYVFDTSAHNSRGTIPVSKLLSADVIVGPDVYTKRVWYANFRGGKIV